MDEAIEVSDPHLLENSHRLQKNCFILLDLEDYNK